MPRKTLWLAMALLGGCATTAPDQGAVDQGAVGTSQRVASPEPASPWSVARGGFVMADGHRYGSRAMVRRAEDGSWQLVLTMLEFPPGTYGMHIHSIGRCDAPDFASAGAHWNPTMRQHGRLNPMGTHHGDLPNLTVSERGIAYLEVPLRGELIGAGGLLDGDGAAIVIHASVDDERTDPTGNSGARIACAVLTPRDQPEPPAT